MIKEVPCMECDGKGFIAKFGEYSVWSERCPNCGGTGTVKVPMTNADRIRAMSDEELAEQLVIAVNGLQPCTLYYSIPTERTFLTEAEAVRITLEWLQQPAEEDT